MSPRRVRLLLAAAILVVTALVAQRLAPPTSAGGDTVDVVAVAVAVVGEGTRLEGRAADGTVAFTFDVTEWRSWADDHLADALGDLPTIADQTLTPERFDRFGAAAASPRGEHVLFSAPAYAMLTTVSVLGLLDTRDLTIEVLVPPGQGDVETIVWSPDGRYAATVFGTARAQGDRLRIDDVQAGRRVGVWTGEDVLQAAERSGQDGIDDASAWTPSFRDLTWREGSEGLSFTISDPADPAAGGAIRASLRLNGRGLGFN